MDNEKEPKQDQQPKSVLGKGLKKLKDSNIKKAFRTIITAIVAKLLPIICIILALYILISAISYFLDNLASVEYKSAQNSTINYTSGSAEPEPNKITVNPDNITSDGAYELMYNFQDKDGTSISEQEVIEKTKEQLIEENEEIEIEKFSDSELKILGTLMSNGLETGKYDEKELKALVTFVKADIAGQTFDLRQGDDNGEVTAEDLTNNDKVYGTIELHKTTATSGGDGNAVYKEIKLEYIPYDTFCSMIEQVNNDVLEKYSIDSSGYLVIAKPSSYTAKYSYEYEDGSKLSDADLEKATGGIPAQDIDEYTIKEYPLQIDYKQYIKKYIVNYGFLSDLLLETNNVDFCLEIAELAFNSKIVLNIREEQIDTYSHDKTNYTNTTLYYDYVTYNVKGYKTTYTKIPVSSGTGFDTIPNVLPDYELSWSGNSWTLNKIESNTEYLGSTSGEQELIVGGHVSETYDSYSIDEDYTAEEIFKYNLTVDTTSRNYKYEIDISEIDCWYLIYEREYASPTVDIYEYPQPDDIKGEYPQEAEVYQELTTDSSIINSDEHVKSFIQKKEQEYLNNHSEATEAEGEATELKIEIKEKTDTTVLEFDGKRTTYGFGDESDIDTTSAQFKNLQYVNSIPTYTANGPQGFLYIYDKYIKQDIDLHLQNDAEKEFFELLENDANTLYTSDIMKFLLYVYDGIDRGVVDLDKTFQVIDMTLMNPYNIATSAFGCNISRDEFITLAQAYGKSKLSDLAPQFYDICEKYNVNPCIAYAWAAWESGWGESADEDKNLFQMGSYNGSSSGFTYDTYEESIEAFCKWMVNASDVSSSQYNFNYNRAKEYAEVNSKFSGTPDKNIYALFSTYSWLGYTHDANARACIKNTYNFLNDGVYECNHADSDETTWKERADYMQYQIEARIRIAEDVFGKNSVLNTNSGNNGSDSGNGTLSGGNGNYISAGSLVIGGDGKDALAGIYPSSSGRQYVEWIQGAGSVGSQPLFDEGLTMGSAGCHVYACGTLASSTGIEPNIWEVYNAYMRAGNCAYVKTIESVLKSYGINAQVCTGNAHNHEDVISVLKSGRGVMIYVKSGYGNLYTKNVHWITLADIRDSELGSEMGYDIYALTSNTGAGHGWHPIETVLKNLAAANFFYIDDGK